MLFTGNDFIVIDFEEGYNVYEVSYELNNRPDWVIIPLKGIKDLLEV